MKKFLLFIAAFVIFLLFVNIVSAQTYVLGLRAQKTGTTPADTDRVTIYFTSGGPTEGWDNCCDMTKINSNDPNVPNIYSYIPGYNLTLDGRPLLTKDKIDTLGFEVNSNGNFTITASEITDFPSGTKIILIDSVLHKKQDLTISPTYPSAAPGYFAFTTASNRFRFYILFDIPSTSLSATITPESSTTFCTGGSVKLDANTGTGYTYQWQQGGSNIGNATTSSYTANSSGSYRVIITQSSESATSSSVTVTVNPRPTAVISGTAAICNGASTNLSVALTGTQPWSLTYTDGTTPVTINNITSSPQVISVSPTSTKTYTVTALSDSKCTSVGGDLTGSAIITVNPRPTAVISGTAAICNGASTNLSVALTGSQPWSLTYTDGTTPVTINNITASPKVISVSPFSTKTYTVTALSDSKCTSVGGDLTGSAVITINPRPTAVISGTAAICNGASTNLSVALTGTQPWSLTYTDGTTPVTINNITASPKVISVSPSSTKTYTVTALSDSKCTSVGGDLTGSAVITVNPRPTAVISGTAAICNGASTNLSVALTGTQPWSLTYTDGTTPVTINNITSSPQVISVSPTSTKTYTVTALNDSKCTSVGGDLTGSAIITVNPRPTAVISGTAAICNGASTNLSVALTGTQPWSLTYTDGTTPVTINNITSSPQVISVSPTSTKTYTVTALSDSKCTSVGGDLTGSAIITVNPRPTAVISGTAAICNGASTNLSVALTGSQPWSLTYTDGTTPVTINNITASPKVISVSPFSTKTYTVTALSDSKCTSVGGDLTGSAVITINPRPTAVISGTAAICNGASTNLSVALTGTQPWSLTYTDGTTPVTINNITASPQVISVSPTSTKTYTVTALNDSKCTSVGGDLTGSAIITVNPRPTAVISGTAAICNGASTNLSVALTGTQPWSLTYTDGTTPVTINNITASPKVISVSPSSTKTYTVTALSDSKCTSVGGDLTGSAVITVNPRPTAVISGTAAICNGASTNLSVALTGTQPWSLTYTDGTTPVTINNITSSPQVISVSPTSTKTYTVTALNDSKCTSVGGDLTGSAIITVNPRPTAVISGTAAICNGASTNLSVALTGNQPWSLTYTDGTTPVTINNITSSPQVISVSPTSTKTYTVTALNDSKCTSVGGDLTGSAVITVNPRPTAVISGTAAICNGASTNLSVALTGTQPWSLTYTDGTTPVTINNITSSPQVISVSPTSTKTYTVTALNDSKCTSVGGDLTGSAIITVNPRPTAVISGTAAICNGASTNLSVALTGNQPWSLTYTDGTTPVTINNITSSPQVISVSPTSTKTYTVTALNDSKCTSVGGDLTGSAVITVNPRPTAVISGTAAICNGASTNLSVALTGTQPWSLTYTDGTTPVTINNITTSPQVISVSPTSTKTYTLTALKDSKCSSIAGDMTGSAVITVNPLPVANAGSPQSICNSTSTTIGAVAVGGDTYSWTSTPAGYSSTNANPSVSPTVTTTYTLTETVTATTCQKTNSVVITVNQLPLANTGIPQGMCTGSSVTIGTAAVGGNIYSWTSSPGTFTSTIANPSVSPTITTTYTLTETVITTSCQKTNSVVITVNQSLPVSISISAEANPLCSGSTVIFSAMPVDGGVSPSYQWKVNGLNTGTNNSIFTYIPLDNDLVTCILTSDLTCASGNPATSNTVKMKLNPNLPISVSVISNANPVCSGVNVTYTANATNGGTSPFYQWKVNGVDAGTNNSSYSYTPINNDVVTCLLTSNEICTTGNPATSNNVNMIVNPLPAANAGSDKSICSGSSTSLGSSAIGGNTYNWTSSPVGFTSTSANPIVNPTVATTYTLTETVTATTCQKSNSVVITVNPLPNANAGSPQTICNGASVTIGATAMGGDTYSWTSTPAGFTSSSSNPSVNPTIKTTYTLTETISATSCQKTNSVVITVNTLPTANTGSPQSICIGSSATLGSVAVGGNTYSWTSLPLGFTSTIANPGVSPSITTTYTLTEIITATSCQKTNTIVVTVNPLPAANAGNPQITCSGSAVTIGAAAVGGDIYSWTSLPAGFTSSSANPSVNPTITTTYTLTETSTATLCQKTNTVIISVNPLPQANAGTPKSICSGSSATIGATAISGNIYSWTSSPAGFSSSTANPSVSPSITTTYTLTEIITATSCQKTNTIVITVNPLPLANAGVSKSICTGLSTPIGASSVTGHTYSWTSSPAGFTSVSSNPNVNPTVTTTYTLTETITSTSCQKTNSVTITVNTPPLITSQPPDTVYGCITNNLLLGITATGTDPLNYKWTKNGTIIADSINSSLHLKNIILSDSGIYRCMVTNSCGSSTSKSVIVSISTCQLPSVTSTIPTNTTKCAGENALFQIEASGTLPLHYQWIKGSNKIPGATTNSLTLINIKASDYDVYSCIVTNKYGSATSNKGMLTVHQKPVFNAKWVIITKYIGDTLKYTLSISGGMSYTYQWKKNDVDIQGASNDKLILNTLKSDDQGRYSCVAYDECGSDTGNVFQLNVVERILRTTSGVLTYDNTNKTPLSNVKLYLKNLENIIVDSATTNSSGEYAFNNLLIGSYTVDGKSTKKWGGGNPLDALMVNRSYIGLYKFPDAIRKKAADVSNDKKVNPLDALLINRRYIGLISKFNSGDWVFLSDTINIAGSDVSMDIMGLCAGDVNGDYKNIPVKEMNSVILINRDYLSINPGERFDLPVYLNDVVELGALGLKFSVPSSQFSVLSVKSNIEGLLYNIINISELRTPNSQLINIAWSAEENQGLNIVPDKPLFYIEAVCNEDLNSPLLTAPFSLTPECIIADIDANILYGETITIPKIQFGVQSSEFRVHASPSPFHQKTVISYQLSEDTHVTIKIFDLYGKEIVVLADEYMPKGLHETTFNADNLPAGIYFYNLQAGDNKFTGKIVLMK